MHPLLERQLRRRVGAEPPAGPAWDELCGMVDSAYRQADDQRRMVERSLELMSEELHARNRELNRQLQSVAAQARVLENVHDAALVLAQDGRIVDCYAATTVLFGLSSRELIGRPFWDVVRPAAAGDTLADILTILPATGRWSGDTAYRRYDGNDGVLATTLIVIPQSAASERHVLAVAQDVTERRRIDRQLVQAQKLDAIGQLAAGVAHEINTPAQYVTDNLHFLEDAFAALSGHARELTALDPDVQAVLDEIPAAIQQSLEGMRRVAEIVRGIKFFAHPGSDERTLVDINREVESTIAVSRNEWKYVADLEARLEPDLPLMPGFAGDIGQVALNLIVNAAHAIGEATDNGKQRRGLITVTTRRVGDHLELAVADDGPGIPPEHQARVFDPFFTTKPVGKGTGQGLSLSRSIVHEKHGGTLRFETAAGSGTTFIVSLPLVAEAGQSPAETQSGAEIRTGTEGP